MELETGTIIKDFKGHNNKIVYIATINLPKYGKSFTSQGLDNDGIKLWINNQEKD